MILVSKKQIYFCINEKKNGHGCGNKCGTSGFDFAKKYLKSIDAWGDDKIKAHKAECLKHCSSGPVCVVYPDKIVYKYTDKKDVQEIIDKNLLKDKKVKHLQV